MEGSGEEEAESYGNEIGDSGEDGVSDTNTMTDSEEVPGNGWIPQGSHTDSESDGEQDRELDFNASLGGVLQSLASASGVHPRPSTFGTSAPHSMPRTTQALWRK